MEALETHAHQLATAPSTLRARPGGFSLLQRLRENGRVLHGVHRRTVAAIATGEPLVPVAEWILDNFYIIREILPEVRQDLPRGYYQKLPKLATGSLLGYPRIYGLALSLMAHTDSNITEFPLVHFLQAYQVVAPLTIGELWALPSALRLALLENLRRLAEQMLWFWEERRQAEAWFQNHLVRGLDSQHELAPFPLPAVGPTDPFIVRLVQLLREHAPSADALEQFEADLAIRGIELQEVVRRENHRQAADQVSVGNTISSLRVLSTLDWKVVFEQTSLVEPILRQDPAGIYTQQDFATRDRSRQAVERLARGSRLSELEVASRVIELARRHQPENSPRDHIGWYLLSEGQGELEKEIGYRPSAGECIQRLMLHHPSVAYFSSLTLLTVAGLAIMATLAGLVSGGPRPGPAVWVVLLLAAFLPLSELAVGLTHFLFNLLLRPRKLARLAFKEGIPADCATFVVVPSMLVQPESVAGLLEKIEVHYLANPDPQLRFALLTDFTDAPKQTMPLDEALLQSTLEGIHRLNERYCRGRPDRFFLFHRQRMYNPSQGCWMGWERKRGKLIEFNRLLRGARDTSYDLLSTKVEPLPPIRFIITLDVDTQLPREAAGRLVATLAHPLNRPHFDLRSGRVTHGYAILQPRVSFHMLAAMRSLFTRIWATSAGIDPYATAVSDVYQDLFGAGTYTGKGIYDIDAFQAALGNTFPTNSILSHDLIEGTYARCGLVSDIQVFDDFPARYHSFSRREHRWVRGDWQLLPWLGRQVPTVPVSHEAQPQAGQQNKVVYIPNPLPLLERWKIIDNLRRSLVPPALLVLLVLGWVVLPGSPWLWTGLAAAVLGLPLVLQTVGTVINVMRSWSLASLIEFRQSAPATFGQVFLVAIFLLNHACLLLDAIFRSLWRLFLSRRWLLEWETSASTEDRLDVRRSGFVRHMWPAPGLALALGLVVCLAHPESVPAAVPFLVAWLFSPFVAFWVSRPSQTEKNKPLMPEAVRELRRIARRTWSFFETFVNDDSHWLPPDNFQEEPLPQIAQRTSPTNNGMLLLSTLAAHDLGFISLGVLLSRLEKTIGTLERLERYRGHYFNWYSTLTLEPLQPAYVSTVDSGNLLGCLLVLRQGLSEKAQTPVAERELAQGLADLLAMITELTDSAPGRANLGKSQPSDSPSRKFHRAQNDLQRQLGAIPSDLLSWDEWLQRFVATAQEMAGHLETLPDSKANLVEESIVWTERLVATAREHLEDLRSLAPWLALFREAERVDGAERLVNPGPNSGGFTADSEFDRAWQSVRRRLLSPCSVAELHQSREHLIDDLTRLETMGPADLGQAGRISWLRQVREAVGRSSAGEWLDRARSLAGRAGTLATAMDFTFLYNADRHLFAIVYNISLGRLDNNTYDLLASEACLASFLAIARGEVPVEHWFHLGRKLARVGSHSRPGLLGRHHVRIPDAAPADALSERLAAGGEYPGGGSRTDRVRPAGWYPLGHLGVSIQ